MLYSKGSNSFGSFFAMLLLTIIVVFSVVIILSSLSDSGVYMNIITSLMDNLPFSGAFAKIALGLLGAAGDVSTSLVLNQKPTIYDLWMDLLKMIAAAFFFEALRNFGEVLIGVKDVISRDAGIFRILKKFLNSVICALIAAYVTIPAFRMIQQTLPSLPKQGRTIISVLLVLLTVGGGIGVSLLLMRTIASALAFVFIKLIVVNAVILAANYVFVLFVMFALQKGVLWGMLLTGLSGWLLIMILMLGIGLILDSMFDWK